jgi:RNase H-like domain found in reverse transcriptase/Reverse transcriptase (RNA-dependent DNA polymerase)
MCNSLATFQAIMDDIFMTIIDNRLVIVYMDNILIFANIKEELERIMKLVLEKLQEHDLFLKAKKCEFCQTRIEYLGMIIKEGKIAMDSVKLGGIRDWPVPTMLKQTWLFLGFGNFYQKFISHYSELARPLYNLMKKDKKFEWSNNCQEAFNIMKKRFTEELVLLTPNQSKPFQIKSDAFKVATGIVLTQLDSNRDWHPVAFLSKTFTETERKYEIYQNFAKNFEIKYLDELVKAYNVDGMENKRGTINTYINLEFKLGDQKFNERFYVTGLGKQKIILGLPCCTNTTR